MKSVKPKIPRAVRLLQTRFLIQEKISPKWAGKSALKYFLTPFRFPRPPREQKVFDLAKKSFFEMGVERVAVYEWGEGPPVWIMHGWGGRATQMVALINALVENGYHVLGIDAPGHGLSTGRQSNVLLFEQALQQLYRIKGPPMAYIGHSFGGAVGFYANSKGLPIQRIVSISAPTLAREIIIEFLEKLGLTEKTYASFNTIFERTYKEPFYNYTALNWVEEVPIPVLVVHDKADTDASINHALALKGNLPDAQYLFTEGKGHIRILRDQKVVQEILRFIKEEEIEE